MSGEQEIKMRFHLTPIFRNYFVLPIMGTPKITI